jgi:DNA polymerase III delta subunit
MVYLFIGEDPLSKDIKLKEIKEEFLNKGAEQFNLDILYAKGLALRDLQERFLSLPVKSPKRIIIIKDAQDLKEDLRGFIIQYVKKPHKNITLVLDISCVPRMDEFINHLYRHAKISRFKETKALDTFALGRWIVLRKPDYALRVLNQLLKDGQRPEWILGGLRYLWERDTASPFEMKRKLKLLLHCDIDIKTGRLKPVFALERLVINLCGLKSSFH